MFPTYYQRRRLVGSDSDSGAGRVRYYRQSSIFGFGGGNLLADTMVSNPNMQADADNLKAGLIGDSAPVVDDSNNIKEFPSVPDRENQIESDDSSEEQGDPVVDFIPVALVSSPPNPESIKAPIQSKNLYVLPTPPDVKTVKFPWLKIPVWSGTFATLGNGEEMLNELQRSSKMLVRGTYLITIRGKVQGADRDVGPTIINDPIEFNISGKRQRIDKIIADPASGIIKMQITIIDNPIIVLSLITAGLIAGGFAAYSLTDTLVQVDKVLDTTIVLSVIGLVGFGVYVWKFK